MIVSRESPYSWRYDAIPDYVLGNSILELGAGWGRNQLGSRHLETLLNADYLGVDLCSLPKEENCPLEIIQGDLIDWVPSVSYPDAWDTVLAIEVLEHIPINYWDGIIVNMKRWTKPGGYLIFSVPYNENKDKSLATTKTDNISHVVYSITKRTIRHFIPDAKIFILKHPRFLRYEDESRLKGFVRYFKRLVIQYNWIRGRQSNSLLVIWKNKKC